MCGIVGFTGPEDPPRLKDMLAAVAHRGPDGEGQHCTPAISLGHKRLSVIDLQSGDQPQHSADGRYTIVFNGEIYNYRELRRELEREGEVFVTRSDTEVLLKWVVRRGVDGLRDLNGMFAFALWDALEGSLLLARDRLGMKPLYYAEQPGGLAFASEVKGLLPRLRSREVDPEALFEFLAFQNFLSDRTLLRGVRKLPPGRWLRWRGGEVAGGAFWDVAFPAEAGEEMDLASAAQAYRETLDRAVERHLVSDVPLGSYLSSGFDSSAVATFAAARATEPLHAFIGAFGDAPRYDERPGAREVAAGIGARLHEVEITPRHFADLFEKVVWHLDEPSVGTGSLPQFVVSKLVSEHVKVVLTGHGGDELFAGYQVNQVALLKERLRAGPGALLRTLAGIRRDEWTRVLYYLLFPLLQPEVRHHLFVMTPRSRRRSLFAADFLAQVAGFEPFAVVDDLLAGRGLSVSQRLTFLYLKTYLPTLLVQEDKVGMAHSIEARMPLLDNEVVALALRVPFATKLARGLKSVPREALRGVLPPALYAQPKRGFPTPFARWFRREPLRDLLHELLLGRRARERGIFREQAIRRALERNRTSRTDTLADYALANRLYSLAVIELWFRLFVDA